MTAVSTFLATRKMDPALIERIERSVAGRRRIRQKRETRRIKTTILRLAIVVAITALATSVLLARRRYRQEVASVRAAVLQSVQAQNAAFSSEDRAFMARVEPWLERLAAAYEGDVTSAEIRSSKDLDAMLARPSVYVRGPTSGFASSVAIAETAAVSTRDALLLCLLDPPPFRLEKDVVAKVRAVYGSGAFSEHARPLHEAADGVRRLLLPWEERLQNANELRDLERIQVDLSKVHVEDAKRAVRAELLIAAMDEPALGPADLDGEKVHDVRVEIVDLRAGKVRLRARKRVDPNWLSASTRTTFAAAADGCALAFDIRGVVH
jgi:hypothetical protein